MSEENLTFEELLNDSISKKNKLDKIVTGKVISISDKGEIYVDLNYKADGIVPKAEFSYDENANPKDYFKANDDITCEVLKINDGQGNVLLSYKRLKSKLDKEEFEKKVKNDEIFEEKVSEKNDKGLIVNYKGIKIFIPNSLSANQTDNVRFKIIEYNPKEHRIIGSCKKILDEEKEQKEKEFFENAEVGKEYLGTVVSICSYGAFVEIDGVQGLLHISEISWDRNAKAQDYLKEGQQIKVKIKEIDKENKRFQLSYCDKGKDPWSVFDKKVGDVVLVTITKIMPFGAFAEIEKGIDGLIHISQISNKKIAKVEDVLKIGEKVNAKIIELDKENKKIQLSIREIEGTSEEYNSLEGENINEELEKWNQKKE